MSIAAQTATMAASNWKSLALDVIILLVIMKIATRVYGLYAAAYCTPLATVPGPWYSRFTKMAGSLATLQGLGYKLPEENHAKYGPIYRAAPKAVVTCDKDAIKKILVTCDLPKNRQYGGIRMDSRYPTLFTAVDKSDHRRLRNNISQAFSMRYLAALEDQFKVIVSQLVNKMDAKIEQAGEQGIIVNMYEELNNVALDLLGDTIWGKSFGLIDGTTGKKADGPKSATDSPAWSSMPGALMRNLWKLMLATQVPLVNLLPIDDKEQRDVIRESVSERWRVPGNPHGRTDIMQIVVDGAREGNPKKMATEKELFNQAAEFLIAGSDTTANTICYTLMSLVDNPDILAKLRETIPANDGTDPAVADIKQNEYLTACLSETLRMFPHGGVLGRFLPPGSKPFELLGHVIPPGTSVTASFRACHFNEEYWPKATKYWPERWMESESDRQGAPAAAKDAFFPFSAGSRSCIGLNFAWMEMRKVMVALLSRYDIHKVVEQDIDFRNYVTLQLKNSEWNVRLTKRADTVAAVAPEQVSMSVPSIEVTPCTV